MFDVHRPTLRATISAIACMLMLLPLGDGALAGPRGGIVNRSPPTIGGTPATTVAVGTAYAFTPTASDPDGQKLSFSIANRPGWASFSKATGRLSGTPTTAGTASGIVITVSDGHYTASLPAFSVSAVAPSPPPAAPPVITGTPSTIATVGAVYSFQPSATDPAGLRITYTIIGKPAWATFSSATGQLSGTPVATDVGTYGNIVIGAYNGTASSTLAPFAITVQAATITGSATLSWAAPTNRTDGSALTNLAGYRIHYGTSPTAMTQVLTLASPAFTDAVVDNLQPATYYFALSAYDASGVESSLTNPVSLKIQ